MPSEQLIDAVPSKIYGFLLWELALGRIRREILQNLIKILQIPVLLICFMGIDFVGFWIDFVGFFSPLRYE